MPPATGTLLRVLDAYLRERPGEASQLDRARDRAVREDIWSRRTALQATASAFVIEPGSSRVLLRWHKRAQKWLHVGGHAEPGESNPFAIALREAREETSLADLKLFPDAAEPQPVQIVIVPVGAGAGEPAHEHLDFRYLLATREPESCAPESADAGLRWVDLGEAITEASEETLREGMRRAREAIHGQRASADMT